MAKYKVKFFGAKERKSQIVQVKMEVEAREESVVENELRRQGYAVIQGLKIRRVEA